MFRSGIRLTSSRRQSVHGPAEGRRAWRRNSQPDPGEGTGLDEAIAAYLTACEVEGKTRRTVQAYAETLGRFRTVCAAEGLPDRVAAFRPAHVYAFLKVISDSGVSLGHPAPPLP